MAYSAEHDQLTRRVATEVLPAELRDPFWRMIRQESSFDLDVIECRRDSTSGARGIAQIIPRWHPGVDPCDPDAALRYAARWLVSLAEDMGGDLRAAVAGYQAGPAAIGRLRSRYGDGWEAHLSEEPTAAHQTPQYLAAVFPEMPIMQTLNVPGVAVTWHPGHPANAYPDRAGYVPEGCVLHIMDGTYAGALSWVQNPAAKAGWLFSIAKDGRVAQHYPLTVAPFAHGSIETSCSGQPAIVQANGCANPNYYLDAIEHEGKPGDTVTPAQWGASTRVCAALFREVYFPGGASGVAVDRDHILGHFQISPKTRARCPSFSEAFFTRYIHAVQALLDPGVEPPPVDPKDVEIARLRARERELIDCLNVHAAAYREDATRFLVRAETIDRVITE